MSNYTIKWSYCIKFFKYQIDNGQSSNTEAVYSAPINDFTEEQHVLYALNEYVKHDFKKIVLRDVIDHTDLNTFTTIIETLNKNNIKFEYFKSDLRNCQRFDALWTRM